MIFRRARHLPARCLHTCLHSHVLLLHQTTTNEPASTHAAGPCALLVAFTLIASTDGVAIFTDTVQSPVDDSGTAWHTMLMPVPSSAPAPAPPPVRAHDVGAKVRRCMPR